jgi:Rrf2 family protein
MSKLVSISEAASIAIHGAILIAGSRTPLNAGQIAERTQTSRHHVAKVLQRLVKEKFIKSLRGPSGGFILTKKPEELSFMDLYEAIEGKIEIQKCPMDKPVCPFEKCIMNNIVSKMTLEFKDYLKEQTIDLYI